ncbi:MAG TPA: NADH-quinone oxidoreductase subunit NuoF [Thermodesulfobacteriota bacterium]|nr:NADH-quinone oxidoreductase subunit NuoF [Thermodesulfobacteriota bacterium]
MTFEETRRRANAHWEAIKKGVHVLVGTATCGRAAGALDVIDAFKNELARQGIDLPIVQVGCVGLCYAEPLVIISKPELRIAYHNISPDLVPRLVEGYILGDDPCLELALGTVETDDRGALSIPELSRFEHELRLILRHCGYIDPENIDDYIANGGYAALEKALRMAPKEIIEEVKKSGLRGRGGAGFDTGLKWESCHQAAGRTKYVVCNADEGDPGAFMDRAILESDPQQVIEGMIIAGYAVGAEQGYIYVRSEYPLAIERVRKALKQAEEIGVLGENILGRGFSFKIKIVEGAGAFVSGEATALVAAMEGRRSEPRVRPPRLAESGLWGCPTLLNNVKTFSYVPLIVDRGADGFASIGTEKNTGTAVFTLAGKVRYPGLTEVPMGTTLRTMVYDIAGGMPNERRLKAVQIGGPSGGCIPESLIDLPVDFDSLYETGSMMGSGGMIFMDEDDCAVDTARFFLDFTTKESCGKCTMCRMGTVQLLSILEEISTGKATENDLQLLEQLAQDVKMGSLCGLGRSAPNPVLTTLRYFGDEYKAHILEKRCPALVCKDLIAYYILPDKCDRACEHCVLVCPTEAIKGGKGEIKYIDQEKCSKCGTCQEVCPPEYRAVVKISPISKLPKAPLTREPQAKEGPKQ